MLLFYLKIRYFWSKIGIKVNNTFLVVDQINYTTKTLNGYILACLYAHIFRMLSIKKLACFGPTNTVKGNDKENRTVFAGKDDWNFGNELARNIVISGANNSS